MSMKTDIEDVFADLAKKHADINADILAAKFGVYEALEWDESARDVVEEMIAMGIDVDGNMLCYLDA